MKSIFELENRLDINNEFEKIINFLYQDEKAALYAEDKNQLREYSNLIEVIDKKVFLNWKYRDTFLNVEEYLKYIGIDYERTLLYENNYIEKNSFLYFLEFLANMFLLIDKNGLIKVSAKVVAIAENIPRILEKMNYKLKELEDRVIITKRNSDVDSILRLVPNDMVDLLLEYNDFRIQKDISAKKKILKELDLYIEKNIKIKSFDNELDNSIGTIVNKMGINHPIKEEPYKSFTDSQLINWYDKCFLMMIHAIRTVEINKVKDERKKLISKS